MIPRALPQHLVAGSDAEARACRHLQDAGLALLERNYRSPFGEIDLVMQERSTIVFVEVRLRASAAFGAPAETVTAEKQAKLRATAEHYLQRHKNASRRPCRFDIVAIGAGATLTWLQNAF